MISRFCISTRSISIDGVSISSTTTTLMTITEYTMPFIQWRLNMSMIIACIGERGFFAAAIRRCTNASSLSFLYMIVTYLGCDARGEW